MLFGVPAPGPFVLTMYKITLPHGYFFTWFFHGFFFRSSLTGIFNVVFSPLFLTWYTPPPHFYTCRYHVFGLIFNVVFSPLFFTWSTPPPHFYTSRYLVKLRMMLAVPWYVQGGQMDENVAAAAARRPGSETLHVFFVWFEGCGLAMARAEGEVLELAGLVWLVELLAGHSSAGGPGGVGRPPQLGCQEEYDRASNVVLTRYLPCRRSGS